MVENGDVWETSENRLPSIGGEKRGKGMCTAKCFVTPQERAGAMGGKIKRGGEVEYRGPNGYDQSYHPGTGIFVDGWTTFWGKGSRRTTRGGDH